MPRAIRPPRNTQFEYLVVITPPATSRKRAKGERTTKSLNRSTLLSEPRYFPLPITLRSFNRMYPFTGAIFVRFKDCRCVSM
jgi:hypothetical protein